MLPVPWSDKHNCHVSRNTINMCFNVPGRVKFLNRIWVFSLRLSYWVGLYRQPIAVSDISIYICLIDISFRSKSKEQLNERRAGLSRWASCSTQVPSVDNNSAVNSAAGCHHYWTLEYARTGVFCPKIYWILNIFERYFDLSICFFGLKECPPGGMSAWRRVRLEACPPGGLSAWRLVRWRDVCQPHQLKISTEHQPLHQKGSSKKTVL